MDITLREAAPDDAEALARIIVTAYEHAFRGLVPDQCLAFTEAESAANWKRTLHDGLPDRDFMVVAQATDGIVAGYVWGGPHDDPLYRGEIRQIAVLPAHQSKGIGRQLVCYVAQRLADEQNIHSLRVSVLRINPNRAFYERLGGLYVSEHPYNWEGETFPECVYGWADTRTGLMERCSRKGLAF